MPPDCHHSLRTPHSCHFGRCPPCKQTCGKTLQPCGHVCPATCHSAVLTKMQEKVSATTCMDTIVLILTWLQWKRLWSFTMCFYFQHVDIGSKFIQNRLFVFNQAFISITYYVHRFFLQHFHIYWEWMAWSIKAHRIVVFSFDHLNYWNQISG